MDFFFSLQYSSPSAERHFRFPVVVTGVTTLSVEQCPETPEDGPEKGRLSLSRPSGLRVMSMYLNYEIHSETKAKYQGHLRRFDTSLNSATVSNGCHAGLRMRCFNQSGRSVMTSLLLDILCMTVNMWNFTAKVLL